MDNSESLPSVTRQAISFNILRPIAKQAHGSFIYPSIIRSKISKTDRVEFAKYYNILLKTNFNDMSKWRTLFLVI